MINKQDYINSFEQDIAMVKGDSLIFGFQVEGTEGTLPTDVSFRCTNDYNASPNFSASLTDSGILLESYEDDVATYSVRIKPEQTANLDVGRYYYDLEMTFEGTGDVYTLMRGNLDIVPEVKGA